MLNDVFECPICLNDINNNEGIIIPECCNNPVHLKCIMNWYEKNNKTNVCFICQQVNNFSKDIHLNQPEIVIRDNLIENNHSEENIQVTNNFIENNDSQENIEVINNLIENNDSEENKECIKSCLIAIIPGAISGIIMLIICL